jgi:hypothetical protein
MLCFIIKRMVICNQEAWDALEEYIKTFDIRSFPGENVPTACLKLKAVLTVLGDRLPSNAVCTILEGFALASTKSFLSNCDSKIAMQSNRIYASLVAKQTLCSQVTSMLDNLEKKYQQLITAKKWEGVGHIGATLTQNSSFNAAIGQEGMEQSYAAHVKSKSRLPFKECAKTQICHHCGKIGHIRPLCRKYLAEQANGTLPLLGKKRFGKLAFNGKPAFNKDKRCDKFDKDQKLKALLSAFAAFTTDYITNSQEESEAINNNDNVEEGNESNYDNLQAFWGMVGSLKE